MTSSRWPTGAEQVARHAQAVLDRIGILANPYFAALESGRMSVQRFAASQRQFSFAVSEFSRPIMCLMARIPDPLVRLGMLDNVMEEHGHFDPKRFHATTFRDFCASLAEADIVGAELIAGPAVEAFNWTLWGVCQSAPVETGLACLGVIEWAFAQISALIGRTVIDRGWVSSERLVHYHLHAELDLEHAGQFFRPLEPRWDDPPVRLEIIRGLEIGAYIFERLYRDLG